MKKSWALVVSLAVFALTSCGSAPDSYDLPGADAAVLAALPNGPHQLDLLVDFGDHTTRTTGYIDFGPALTTEEMASTNPPDACEYNLTVVDTITDAGKTPIVTELELRRSPAAAAFTRVLRTNDPAAPTIGLKDWKSTGDPSWLGNGATLFLPLMTNFTGHPANASRFTGWCALTELSRWASFAGTEQGKLTTSVENFQAISKYSVYSWIDAFTATVPLQPANATQFRDMLRLNAAPDADTDQLLFDGNQLTLTRDASTTMIKQFRVAEGILNPKPLQVLTLTPTTAQKLTALVTDDYFALLHKKFLASGLTAEEYVKQALNSTSAG